MDTASEALELTAGQSVHHYTLVHEIGRGGMASVFLARDARLERLVAIKLLRRLVPELTRRFLAEARIIARCSHENIVVIHDVNEFERQPYLVLEYLRGHTLRHEIAKSRQPRPDGARPAVPPGRAVALMVPVVRALTHAHQSGIVHRDLKPENIFVTREGTLKVLDFGIAKVLQSDLALTHTIDVPESIAAASTAAAAAALASTAAPPAAAVVAPHTRDGAIMGTLPYMAPEQWRGQDVDHRADIWAAGIMLYEMIAGAHPLAPADYGQLQRVANLDEPMPRAAEARPDLGELARLIDHCLIKDPARRLARASELLAALESLTPMPSMANHATWPAHQPHGRLWNVPDAPPHHRKRDQLAPLVDALLAKSGPRLGLHGMGGAGKSVLAAAAVMTPEVRERYPGGVFWLSVGQEPEIAILQTRLARALGDSKPALDDPAEGKQRLKELLAGKPALIVLDDVWDVDHVAYLDVAAAPGRLLMTTRDLEILAFVGAREIHVNEMSAAQAQALLAEWTDSQPEDLPAEAAAVARACGYLPLALALAGALVKLRKASFSRLLDWLEQANLTRIKGKVPAYPYRSVLSAIEVSVDALDGDDIPCARQCYVDLAVFPAGASIPRSALCVLWARHGLDQADTDDLLATLVTRALAVDVDGGDGNEPCEAIRLHDLQHSYVRARTGDMTRLHGALVDAYAAECDHGLARGPGRGAGYFYKNLPYHLVHAGRRDTLAGLLGDFDWLCGKLLAAGVAELLADFDRLAPEHLSAQGLGLLRDAVRLSSHVLDMDFARHTGDAAAQLAGLMAGQLVGRLDAWASTATGPIGGLLDRARSVRADAWLRPLGHTLVRPGGALVYTRSVRSSRVGPIALTPEGGRAVLACAATTIEFWDLKRGEVIASVAGHDDWINALAMSPDGTRVVSASDDRTCKVWDVDSGALVCTFAGHEGAVTAVAVCAEPARVISASLDGTLRVWDMDQGHELTVMHSADTHESSARIQALAVTPDSSRLVCGQEDGLVVIRDIKTGAVIRELAGHAGHVTSVAVTHDGTRVISGGQDATVRIRDMETGASLHTLTGHSGAVTAVALTRQGSHVVSASTDRTLRVWPLANPGEPRVLRVHAHAVAGLAAARRGDVLASVSRDRTLRVWDARYLDSNASGHAGHTGEINAVAAAVAAADAGARALSAASDRRVLVWDAQRGTVLGELSGPGARPDQVTALAMAPHAPWAAAGRIDGAIELWNLDTREQVAVLSGHTREVTALAIHGAHLVSASCDGTLRRWSLDTRAPVHTMEGHASVVQALALTADGSRAVTTSYDKTVRIWDLHAGRLLHTMDSQGSMINALAITPDGTRVVSAGNDTTLRVWELAGGRLVHTLEGHSAVVWSVAITSDGTRALSVSSDTTARVWDLASGRPMHTLSGHTRQVVGATLLPNDVAITISYDKTVRAWNLATGRLMATFTGEAPMLMCTRVPGTWAIMAADEAGRVYFLDLVQP